MIAGGRTAIETSRLLGTSAHTVCRHLSNLATKLGVRGRTGLVRYAIDHQLLGDAD